jgi:hypothetical protein
MASEWRFNRDYNDLEQVRPFLPAFRARLAELEAAGYERMTEVSGPVKCSHIVLYPTRRMGGEWAEYRDARLTPLPYGGMAVLPKGRRTRGYFVNDRAVLALRVKG